MAYGCRTSTLNDGTSTLWSWWSVFASSSIGGTTHSFLPLLLPHAVGESGSLRLWTRGGAKAGHLVAGGCGWNHPLPDRVHDDFELLAFPPFQGGELAGP